MKRFIISAIGLFVAIMASATDLWEGSHAVEWDNTLNISADKFADMKVGQKIVLEFSVTKEDIIELHSDGLMLSGTRYGHRLYNDNTSVEIFVTQGMLDKLRDTGMEVCGSGFTLTKAWYGDGKEDVMQGTVWTGYFWMDEWTTLELAKTAFDGVDWTRYKAIRFYSEAGRTDYVINVKTSWDETGHIADAATMTMTDEYAELNIENINMDERLASTDRLMIQCNKENGAPFNFTSVTLVAKDGGTTAIGTVVADKVDGDCWNLSGSKVSPLSRGIVVKNGKKYLRK